MSLVSEYLFFPVLFLLLLMSHVNTWEGHYLTAGKHMRIENDDGDFAFSLSQSMPRAAWHYVVSRVSPVGGCLLYVLTHEKQHNLHFVLQISSCHLRFQWQLQWRVLWKYNSHSTDVTSSCIPWYLSACCPRTFSNAAESPLSTETCNPDVQGSKCSLTAKRMWFWG